MMKKIRVKNQLLASLIINRCLYGSLSVLLGLTGLFYPHTVRYFVIEEIAGDLFFLSIFLVFSGLLLLIDAFCNLLLILSPTIRYLSSFCEFARMLRPLCFMPSALCYLFMAWTAFDANFKYDGWLFSGALNFILAFFGLISALHETLIVNEKNRYKENVCRKY